MKRQFSMVLWAIFGTVSWAAAAEPGDRPVELLVRGDDMGHSLDVNLAFIKAHTEGILTSASLMAPALYFDWHMASNGGKERPEIEELFRRLSREYGLLYSHDAQDFDGRYSGAKFFPAGLEAWGTQVLPDGRVAYWCGPDLPEATRLKFLDSLKNLQPGTWYTLCHPGLYARRQAQSVAVICSQEVKTSSARAAFD